MSLVDHKNPLTQAHWVLNAFIFNYDNLTIDELIDIIRDKHLHKKKFMKSIKTAYGLAIINNYTDVADYIGQLLTTEEKKMSRLVIV